MQSIRVSFSAQNWARFRQTALHTNFALGMSAPIHHFQAAALTVLSFTLTLICVLAIIFLLRSRRGAGKADQMDLVAAK